MKAREEGSVVGVCPSCEFQNRSGARYCSACSTPLLGGTDAISPLVAQSPPVQQGVPSAPVAVQSTAPLAEDVSGVAAQPPVPLEEEDSTAVTQPATPPKEGTTTQSLPPSPFGPLPEDAFIGDQYYVRQIQSAAPHLNVYCVEDTLGVQPCPSPACGFLYNPSDDKYCNRCGNELANVQVFHPPYLVKESDDEAAFSIEARIVELGLDDPALRLPRNVFQQRVGGAQRHYLILPPPATPLTSVQVPQEAPQVLDWGIALAKGLAVLHQQGIAFGPLEGERIVVEGEQASWAEFSRCAVLDQPHQDLEEVRALAGWLFYLLTGREQYSPEVDLPDQLKALFTQAVSGAVEFASLLEGVQAEMRRPSSVDLRVGRRTDVGMTRQLNEDSMLTLDLVWNNRSVSSPVGVYVVADGMGGHAAGEVASGMTIQAIAQAAIQDLFTPTIDSGSQAPNYEDWLIKAVTAANTVVVDRVKATGSDMGTTLVMALVVGDETHIAHVGDSRAYLINAHDICPLTTDHSLVERLVATNQITREEARFHPQRSVIYRTIGDKRDLEVDVTRAHLAAGDRLLLCSDGLNGMVDDDTIRQLVMVAPSPQAACDQLIKAANDAGGDDNITVIIVQVEEVH